jgi:hypothetical protein
VASWTADLTVRPAPAGEMARFGRRACVAPSEPSSRRVLRAVLPGEPGAVIGSWLAGQADAGTLDARRVRRLAARLAAPAVR